LTALALLNGEVEPVPVVAVKAALVVVAPDRPVNAADVASKETRYADDEARSLRGGCRGPGPPGRFWVVAGGLPGPVNAVCPNAAPAPRRLAALSMVEASSLPFITRLLQQALIDVVASCPASLTRRYLRGSARRYPELARRARTRAPHRAICPPRLSA
jgi:hypothetical protein